MNTQKILKAGEIAKQAKEYARTIVKKDVPLLEIAEKIEAKIHELGGKIAFPTNLSINEIAAHYTPSYNDETKVHGLLKVDLGVHVDGWIADTAFSVDLENSNENKKLIESSKKALNEAIKTAKKGIEINKIGQAVQDSIESDGFAPIVNLTGHQMNEYALHTEITIPNTGNKSSEILKKGLYAIEPFATTGTGRVIEGKSSGIYVLINDEKNIRSPEARKALEFIKEEYKTLPFCSRWVIKKLGTKALFSLKQLEDNENLHHYPQLIEASRAKVSQAENTILVEDKVTITTE